MCLSKNLLELLKGQKYTECLFLLKETHCETFDVLIIESKVYKRRETKKVFWESDLAFYVIPLVLKSDNCIDLLHPYFTYKEPLNYSLLLKIWNQAPKLFITLFKRFQRFKYNTWLEGLKKMATSVISSKRLELNMLINEAKKIQALENSIPIGRNKDFKLLLNIPIDKILIGFCFAHGAMMESQEINGNNTRKKELDMAIVKTLDFLLKYLIKETQTYSLLFKNNITLQSEWEYFRPKHKSEIHKEVTYTNESTYTQIQKIIDNDINRQSKRYLISAYTSEMCFFDGFELSSIQYNDKHSLFKKDDGKSAYEECYFFMNTQAKTVGMKEGQFDSLSIAKALILEEFPNLSLVEQFLITQIANFEFYQIPLVVPETNIDFKLVLRLLKEFSHYKGPLSRIFHREINKKTTPENFDFKIYPDENVSVTLLNEPPNFFSQLLGSNEAISVFDYDNLLKKLSLYYNKSIAIIKENIDFLICDLNEIKKISEWLQRPFIKVNNKVFWLGRLLKDRRWDIILRSKLKEDKNYVEKSIHNAFVRRIDKSLERAAGKLFRDNNFLIDVGWKFPKPLNPRKEGGDIDVIAYKDKFLFVVQIKNSGYSDAIRQGSYIEDKQLLNQAAKQLDNSLNFISNNWNAVQKKFNFNHKAVDVTIFPLIITNVYNGDSKYFKSYSKISLFELYIIMNNAKKELYRSSLHLHTSDRANPGFNQAGFWSIFKNDFDLWDKKMILEPSIIIKCIENDSVWKDLEKLRNFKN